MLAAVIQLCAMQDLQTNLAVAKQWMLKAVQQGATLLVLPENFSYMGETHATATLEEQQSLQYRENPDNSPSLQFLQAFARQHRVWIVGGSIPLAIAGTMQIHNSCFVVDDQGQVQGRYDKIHLFDANLGTGVPYRESNYVQAGNRAVLVDTPFGKIGLTICYDLRFPELFQMLSAQGATLFTVPAAFALMTGKDHWHLLLRARAVENMAYVLAAGQEGKHARGGTRGRQTFGHSLIVEPWGTVVAQCHDGPGFALAELQPDRLKQCRQRIPCLDHRVGFSASC